MILIYVIIAVGGFADAYHLVAGMAEIRSEFELHPAVEGAVVRCRNLISLVDHPSGIGVRIVVQGHALVNGHRGGTGNEHVVAAVAEPVEGYGQGLQNFGIEAQVQALGHLRAQVRITAQAFRPGVCDIIHIEEAGRTDDVVCGKAVGRTNLEVIQRPDILQEFLVGCYPCRGDARSGDVPVLGRELLASRVGDVPLEEEAVAVTDRGRGTQGFPLVGQRGASGRGLEFLALIQDIGLRVHGQVAEGPVVAQLSADIYMIIEGGGTAVGQGRVFRRTELGEGQGIGRTPDPGLVVLVGVQAALGVGLVVEIHTGPEALDDSGKIRPHPGLGSDGGVEILSVSAAVDLAVDRAPLGIRCHYLIARIISGIGGIVYHGSQRSVDGRRNVQHAFVEAGSLVAGTLVPLHVGGETQPRAKPRIDVHVHVGPHAEPVVVPRRVVIPCRIVGRLYGRLLVHVIEVGEISHLGVTSGHVHRRARQRSQRTHVHAVPVVIRIQLRSTCAIILDSLLGELRIRTQAVIGGGFVAHGCIFPGMYHLRTACHLLHALVHTGIDTHLAVESPLGGDADDSVRALYAIDGSGCRILQYRDGFDLVGHDVNPVGTGAYHAVDDDQHVIVTVNGRQAANQHRHAYAGEAGSSGGIPGLPLARHGRKTGQLAGQRMLKPRDREFLESAPVDRAHRSGSFRAGDEHQRRIQICQRIGVLRMQAADRQQH